MHRQKSFVIVSHDRSYARYIPAPAVAPLSANAAALAGPMAGLLVVGFLAGAATGIFAPRSQLAVCGLIGLAAGLMLGLPVWAIWQSPPATLPIAEAVQIFLRLLAATGAIAALGGAAWRIFRLNEALDLHSEWGTLGQGGGGWRMTPAAGLLLLGLLLAALALMAPAGTPPPAGPRPLAQTR